MGLIMSLAKLVKFFILPWNCVCRKMKKNLDFFKIKHNNTLPEKGKVLVSEPFLQDAYFRRSVVLLVEHNEEGTLGVVLNNTLEYDIAAALPDFPQINSLLGIGGPVRSDTVHTLHQYGDLIPGSSQVLDDIFWGGDFETIKLAVLSDEIDDFKIRFFAGISSWYPGQLDKEIRENSWLVTNLDGTTIMSGFGPELWKETLMKEAKRYRMWTLYPENPLLN